MQEIEKLLPSYKMLLVLDDAWISPRQTEISHLLPKYNGAEENRFADGSVVVITSRDKELLLEFCSEENIYPVDFLNLEDSRKVFKGYLYQDPQRLLFFGPQHIIYDKRWPELVDAVVEACAGLPLALKVMNSSLKHSVFQALSLHPCAERYRSMCDLTILT